MKNHPGPLLTLPSFVLIMMMMMMMVMIIIIIIIVQVQEPLQTVEL